MMTVVSRLLTVLAAGLTLAATGCGNSSTSVTGSVTYKGKRMTYGNVILVASDGTTYSGSIEPDGSFKVDKVPPGNVKIGVSGPAAPGVKPPPGGRGDAAPNAPPPPPKDAVVIPVEYRDPEVSGLTGTIKAGQPLNIDIP